jgi:hypothetical protein
MEEARRVAARRTPVEALPVAVAAGVRTQVVAAVVVVAEARPTVVVVEAVAAAVVVAANTDVDFLPAGTHGTRTHVPRNRINDLNAPRFRGAFCLGRTFPAPGPTLLTPAYLGALAPRIQTLGLVA